MKYIKVKSLFCFILSMIIVFSGFAVFSSAKTITVVKQPDKRTFYQGIDWMYNSSNIITLTSDPDLKGTVVSDGSKNVEYIASKMPNMYAKPDSGKWTTGSNTMRIYCDDFSGYATTAVSFVTVSSISVTNPPSNTVYIKGIDWKTGPMGDVEFTKCDLTGIKLSVKYSDGSVKSVSYPENQFISWSVGSDYAEINPGNATLYASFCGKLAPFNVTFANTNPFKLGDVTKDGSINSYDALVILQSATGSITLDSSKKNLADVNKDGNINSLDALLVLQYTVGKISSL